MPCDTILSENQTIQQRAEEVDTALKRLERYLQTGSVKVKIGPNGAMAFEGWKQDRNGVSDVCAYRLLAFKGSSALRMAVARAEAMAGRKLNPRAIQAGTHSHDGGDTWHKGH